MSEIERDILRKKLEFRFRKEMITAGLDPVHTPMVGDGRDQWPVGEQLLAGLVNIALELCLESAESAWTEGYIQGKDDVDTSGYGGSKDTPNPFSGTENSKWD